MQPRYDLLLKGGRVIDPAQGIDGRYDVAIGAGRIAAVAPSLARETAREIIDVSGRLVLPGLIDTHAHVFEHVSGRFGLNADLVGVRSGVTTVVGQGGPGSITLPGFRAFIVEPAVTRVLAFISTYVVGGLEGHHYTDLYGPGGVDVKACVKAIEANCDLVKGIKGHAEIGGYARWGNRVAKLAKEASRQGGVPLYVHLGQLWPLPESTGETIDPDTVVAEFIELMDPGDILAHPFTRHPGGFVDRSGRLHPAVREALARGILVDVGRGSHFTFTMARKALDAGVMPFTLGADMHGYNTKLPSKHRVDSAPPDEEHAYGSSVRFSLTRTMTELVALGLRLEDVVPMVTSNCASLLKMDGTIGTLRPGVAADVSVLGDERGHWVLRDDEGSEITTDRMLHPLFCLRAGVRYEADAPILPDIN